MNKNTFRTVKLEKGEMHIYDGGAVRLHAYKTNDPIDNEVFIVEKDGRAVLLESPCFYDNIRELTAYLKDMRVEGMLVAYHAAGGSFLPDVPKYATQSAKDYAEAGGGKALIDGFSAAFGAGAGLSAAAGLAYDGERFERLFADFREAYGFTDMYTGGFYPYETPEAYWAWWSRHILANRYDVAAGEPYLALLRLLRDKDYFVLTTNVDHQFRLAGFPKARLFYTQGDYGLWQCAAPCHDGTYDNEAAVRAMAASQRGLRVPAALLPRCPVCGGPMTMNLRCDERFVQDEGWYAAAGRCEAFLRRLRGRRVLFLELGVGANTPAVIKFPFWRMTAANPDAVYACVNLDFACCPAGITARSLCIRADISAVLAALEETA